MMNKSYIGDGVYVAVNEAGQVVITTEDGIKTTNEIFLEPEVLGAFLFFVIVYLKKTNPLYKELWMGFLNTIG